MFDVPGWLWLIAGFAGGVVGREVLKDIYTAAKDKVFPKPPPPPIPLQPVHVTILPPTSEAGTANHGVDAPTLDKPSPQELRDILEAAPLLQAQALVEGLKGVPVQWSLHLTHLSAEEDFIAVMAKATEGFGGESARFKIARKDASRLTLARPGLRFVVSGVIKNVEPLWIDLADARIVKYLD